MRTPAAVVRIGQDDEAGRTDMTGIKATARAVMVALATATACAAFAQAPAEPAASTPPQVDCRPRYPNAALRAQVQGVTRLAFHVDATGKLTQVDIVRSSGPTREHRMLDSEAARALSLCPFTAELDEQGHPVDSVFEVSYTWRLQ